MIEIDGSIGGGQLLRTAVTLSALTGKGVKVVNIRKGKAAGKPGLRPQHMTGIEVVGGFCNAEILGLKEWSLEVEFRPWQISLKDKKIDIGTAGSISLLLQTLLPILAFGKKEIKLEIKGGTEVSWSPTIQYIQFVLLPILRKMGINIELETIKHGYYPRGGGLVVLRSYPVNKINPLYCLEKGNILGIHVDSVIGNLPKDVAERQGKSGLGVLQYDFPNAKFSVSIKEVESLDIGGSVTCYANCENSVIGSDALFERGSKAEIVGIRAAENLIASLKSNAAVDKFMADQLLVFMALADGKSTISIEKITEHVLTNIQVIEKFLDVKFEVDDKRRIISVSGIGFSI
jgi:RNA 3'-phosphate cyclase